MCCLNFHACLIFRVCDISPTSKASTRDLIGYKEVGQGTRANGDMGHQGQRDTKDMGQRDM